MNEKRTISNKNLYPSNGLAKLMLLAQDKGKNLIGQMLLRLTLISLIALLANTPVLAVTDLGNGVQYVPAGTNVGIGIASPTKLLHVNGEILATTFNGDGSALTGVSSDTLGGFAYTDFLKSNGSDSYTSGTLTFDAGTTVDINSTTLQIADTDITFDGASTTFTQSSGAFTLAPAAGSNLNVSLSGTGDFVVNTNDLYVDTSAGAVGINDTSPDAMLDIVIASAAEQGLILQAAASQSANLTEWQNGSGTVFAHITEDGEFSNTVGRTASEVFGDGATTGGDYSTVIGYSATATLGQSVSIGRNAYAAGAYAVAIGSQAGATTTGVKQGAIRIGRLGEAALESVSIGDDAKASYNYSIAIGKSATTTAAFQLVMGATNRPIQDAYIGEGVTDATPSDTTFHATGGSGTDVNGASLTLAAGIGTGSGAGGELIFQTANGGASGTSLNTLDERMRITDDGNVGINSTVPTATLQVNGTFQYVDGNEANGYVLTSDANGLASWTDSANLSTASGADGSIQFASSGGLSSNASTLHWDISNGRLGIGTVSPESVLYVGDANTSTGGFGSSQIVAHSESGIGELSISSSNINSNNTLVSQLSLMGERSVGSANRVRAAVRGYQGDNTNLGEMRLGVDSGGSIIEIMTLKNSNVGIDFTSPTAKLAINGSIMIVDGNQADGFILSSNASGLATWVNADTLTAGDADTVDGFHAVDFLKSNGSDSFTSGTLTLAASTALDAGAAESLEVPNSAAPTLNAAGELALDTTITSYTPLLKYYSGAEEMTVVGMPTSEMTTTDGHVVAYNSTNGEFEMVQISAGEWTDTGSVLHPNEETVDNVVVGGTTTGGADIILGVDGSAIFNEQGADVDFRIESNNMTNVFVVNGTTDGVGMGTNTPDGILHLDNGTSNTDFIIEKDNTTQGRVLFHTEGSVGAMFNFNTNEDLVIENETSDKDIVFKVNDGGVDTELARMDGSTSRFGIGYATPSQKLSVNGTVMSTGIRLEDGNQAAGYLLTSDAGGNGSWASAASLNLDADTVDGFHAVDFLKSNGSDSFTSGTLTLASGTTINPASGSTVNIDGDLTVADTNISFDGASTTFTQTTGAFTMTPAAGSNLNVSLSGAGDFVVNTNDLYVDTSAGNIGIGTTAPAEELQVNGSIHITESLVFDEEYDNSTSGAAKTIDWTLGNRQTVQLTANTTLTFTAPAGTTSLLIRLVQDGTGSRTVTWPGTVKWPSGTAPTLTTTASGEDIVTCYYNETSYYCQASLDFQ